jgi:butyrate kinase
VHYILALNPGSTSTKIGYFEDDRCLFKETLRHHAGEAAADMGREEQAGYRRKAILEFLGHKKIDPGHLSALVVRGGLLKPLPSGTYLVDDAVYDDLFSARYGWHASNLAAIIALPLARDFGLPVYTVDPVTVDELAPPARFSGLAGVPRLSMSHALNMKAAARLASRRQEKKYEELNLVVVHLGSGTSVSAHRKGRMVDVNNANEEGPFSMERCGTLPALALVRFCYSGKYSQEEAVKELTSRGGIFSYLGTKDFAEVEKNIAGGDNKARAVVEAMAYQVAKEIGAMSAVLDGSVDMIVITGGMANAENFVTMIKKKISFIAPVEVIPGEEELEALAAGALRVLRGESEALIYRSIKDQAE